MVTAPFWGDAAANNNPRSYLSTAPHNPGRSIGGKPLTALSPKPPFPPPTARARNRATVLIVVLQGNTTAPKSSVTSYTPSSAGHNTAFCPFLALAVACLRTPSKETCSPAGTAAGNTGSGVLPPCPRGLYWGVRARCRWCGVRAPL